MSWSVYLLLCQPKAKTDSRCIFYTGISTNVSKRIADHFKGKGAACMSFHTLLCYAVVKEGLTRSEALKEEARIKKLSHAEKRGMFWGERDEVGSLHD